MSIEELELQELKQKKIRVGILFGLALVLAMIFAYWMGAFGIGPTKHFFVDYEFAGGVDKGTPVRFAGIKVGRVSDVEFLFEKDKKIRLKIEVSREALSQVTDQSQFYVNLAGIIGERYVEVVTTGGVPIKGGNVFRGVDPPRVDQLLSQGYGIFGDIRKFFDENKGDMKGLLNSVHDLAVSLNSLLQNATPEQRKKFNTLLNNLTEMSGDLRVMIAGMKNGVQYLEGVEGKQTLASLDGMIKKANQFTRDDLRRLMLEDGIKVNFSKTSVPDKVPTEVSK